MRYTGMLVLLCSVLLLPVVAAAAETFSARLMPRPGTGATGSGVASLTLDDQATSLSFNVEYSGLTGPEEASHIHRPDGSIAFALPPGESKVGVWEGIGLIEVLLLRSEQLYILVHTEQNPGGELRGDIKSGPLATDSTSWGAVKALYRPSLRAQSTGPRD